MSVMARRAKLAAQPQQYAPPEPVMLNKPPAPAPAPVNNIADPNANPERFKQFDVMRMRAQQAGNTAKQEQGEALKRRFAALGNVNSGAYFKTAGLQEQEADRATNEAVQNVDLQEQQERSRLQDTADERKFQAGEAEKLRIFNKDLFEKDQSFKTMVFNEENRARWADLNESMKANKLNALQAVSGLSDEALRAASGVDVSSGFLGIGAGGHDKAIAKILKGYGY